MRRKFISKLVLGAMITTTLSTLVPVKASAEWVKDYQNNWYYVQDNQRLTGWKKIDGELYYFDTNGKMQTGWIKAENSYYFLQNNGAMKKGWIKYNNNLYYADSDGVMQTGTINIEGRVYILGDNGILKTSNTVVNGQFYTIGLDGQVVGNVVPTPDKEFDSDGNCIAVIKNTNSKNSKAPTSSSLDNKIEDETYSDDDPNEGRTFKVKFRDSNGAELKTVSAKNGKDVDLYEPAKDGFVFAGWDTKINGSGKGYDADDSIEVKEDITLYAQWSEDTAIYVDEIVVKGNSNVVVNGTIQMTAEVSPSDVTNKNITWTVENGTGKASINENGVLTGIANGTVTVKATAKDGSKVSGMKEVTVSASEIIVPVTQILVASATDKYAITANHGTLQMEATVLPTNANEQGITWTVENKTGSASIDSKGLVTATSNGTVLVKATAKDDSEVVGSTTITITGQSTQILVDSIVVNAKGGIFEIKTDAAEGGTSGTLQMNATVSPTTATNKLVTWTVVNGTTGKATISSSGLLTAAADGTVTVVATAKDDSGKVETADVKITGQSTKVTSAEVIGTDDVDTISTNGGTLQMVTNLTPDDSSYKTLVWSVENKTGSATIDSHGILTAKSNGTVDVIATITNKNGSKVIGRGTITLENQSSAIPATSVVVTGTGNATAISTDDGTLQMIATLLPTYATTPSAVTWSVINGTGAASISSYGLLKASTNGTVKVKASVTNADSTIITGTKDITLRGQYIQVRDITITSANIDNEVEVNGTLQMSAAVNTDATYQTVTWSIENPAGYNGGATINPSTGLLKATAIGVVKVVATADNGKGITLSQDVTVIPPVKITGITVTGESDATTIITDKGTLQMSAAILPTDATNLGITWSVEKVGDVGTTMDGNATIDSNTGLLKAVGNGTVTVKATAKDGSGVVGALPITISGQVTKVTGIAVNSEGNVTTIPIIGGTLKMSAVIAPDTADNQSVTWSVINGTGTATIDSDGTLHGLTNGTVTVKATAADGTGIFGTKVITINGIASVAVTGADTVASGQTLQLGVTITPNTVANKTVTWTVIDFGGTGESTHAAIDAAGKLTAISAGVVAVTATATDGSSKSGIKYITIT